jgi:PHP family Zn ribbon phosphoesterase
MNEDFVSEGLFVNADCRECGQTMMMGVKQELAASAQSSTRRGQFQTIIPFTQ